MNLKKSVIALVVGYCAVFCTHAAGVMVESMPHWIYADTEVSTNCQMRFCRNPAEDLRLFLEFSSGESNNVEVAFGCDANTNGVLELSERGLSVGWDCGIWFIRSLGECGVLCAPVTTNVEKRLDFAMHVSGYRAKRLACLENDVPLEFNFREQDSSRMFNPQWNMVRLAVRGVDGNCESFGAAVIVDGTSIKIR